MNGTIGYDHMLLIQRACKIQGGDQPPTQPVSYVTTLLQTNLLKRFFDVQYKNVYHTKKIQIHLLSGHIFAEF